MDEDVGQTDRLDKIRKQVNNNKNTYDIFNNLIAFVLLLLTD